VEGLSPGYAIPTTTTLLPLGGTSGIRACLIRATAHFIRAIVRVRTIVHDLILSLPSYRVHDLILSLPSYVSAPFVSPNRGPHQPTPVLHARRGPPLSSTRLALGSSEHQGDLSVRNGPPRKGRFCSPLAGDSLETRAFWNTQTHPESQILTLVALDARVFALRASSHNLFVVWFTKKKLPHTTAALPDIQVVLRQTWKSTTGPCGQSPSPSVQ